MYIMGYGAGRFWVEGLRIDHATEIGGLRLNQWVALSAVVVGAIVLAYMRRHPIPEPVIVHEDEPADPDLSDVVPDDVVPDDVDQESDSDVDTDLDSDTTNATPKPRNLSANERYSSDCRQISGSGDTAEPNWGFLDLFGEVRGPSSDPGDGENRDVGV